jgi:hypothetical protein
VWGEYTNSEKEKLIAQITYGSLAEKEFLFLHYSLCKYVSNCSKLYEIGNV